MPERRKILVVDDEQDICYMLQEVLELKGHDVATADNGLKALELAAGRAFDFALLDMKMHGMNGVETFRSLKKILPDIKVIIISAYAGDELIEEALREGAVAALLKPVDFDALFEAIDKG